MSVCLHLSMYAPGVHVWCLQRPEGGITCAGTRFRWVWTATWYWELHLVLWRTLCSSLLHCLSSLSLFSFCESVTWNQARVFGQVGCWSDNTILAFRVFLYLPVCSHRTVLGIVYICHCSFKSFAWWSTVVILLELEICHVCILICNVCNEFLTF